MLDFWDTKIYIRGGLLCLDEYSYKCLLSSVSKWVINSGASDHLPCNQHLMFDFHNPTSTSHATITDGSTPQVLGYGTTDLAPSISLSYVLMIPNFSYNLLLASKITRGLNCGITFFPNYCVF